MSPDGFRRRWGFALCGAATLTLLTAVPSLAQGLSSSQLMGAVPLAVALGAGAFAMLAIALIRSIRRDGQLARHKASAQIASLRALVDDYEALLSSASEITVVWSGREAPQFFGPASALLPPGRRVEAVLNFEDWLTPADAAAIPGRVTGECRADARLAWFVASHFDPSLVLPTPTTTSALPLPAVPES